MKQAHKTAYFLHSLNCIGFFLPLRLISIIAWILFTIGFIYLYRNGLTIAFVHVNHRHFGFSIGFIHFYYIE